MMNAPIMIDRFIKPNETEMSCRERERASQQIYGVNSCKISAVRHPGARCYHLLGPCLHLVSMILGDFFVAETKEARGVIVKDVTLLLRCQEVGCLDRLNSNFNGSRPNHLI
jgi:hypothetical protein